MKVCRHANGAIVLTMTEAEAVVLHEAVAAAEFAHDLRQVDLDTSAEQQVFSDVQQALAPTIPGLGTDRYQDIVNGARASIDVDR